MLAFLIVITQWMLPFDNEVGEGGAQSLLMVEPQSIQSVQTFYLQSSLTLPSSVGPEVLVDVSTALLLFQRIMIIVGTFKGCFQVNA